MNILEVKTRCGLGDIIYVKIYLDQIKNRYDVIKIDYDRDIIREYRKDDFKAYHFYLDKLFFLFFSESPYKIEKFMCNSVSILELQKDIEFFHINPDLSKYLCFDFSLFGVDNYIAISTKVRQVSYVLYNTLIKSSLLKCISTLSNKYKILIIGEREVGLNKEYKDNYNAGSVFCIYDDLMSIKNDNIIDFTSELPEGGYSFSVPSLCSIFMDCSLMNKAVFNICLGIGGNFGLAASSGKTVTFHDVTYGNNPDIVFGDCQSNDKLFVITSAPQFIEFIRGI